MNVDLASTDVTAMGGALLMIVFAMVKMIARIKATNRPIVHVSSINFFGKLYYKHA